MLVHSVDSREVLGVTSVEFGSRLGGSGTMRPVPGVTREAYSLSVVY
jgi:hypothetical protein